MRHFFARGTIAILLALQSFSPFVVFGQEAVRPRRSQPQIEPARTSAPPEEQWKPPARAIVSFDQSTAALDSKQEPTIRVALATDVRSATISTTGHLMNATDVASTLVPMDIARVRVEPAALAASSVSTALVSNEASFKLQIEGWLPAPKQKKDRATWPPLSAKRLKWLMTTMLNRGRCSRLRAAPRVEVDELRARLEDAGFDVTVVPVIRTSPPAGSTSAVAKTQGSQVQTRTSSVIAANSVRPVARFSSPSREVVAFAASAGRLFSSSAPVTFASDG